MKSYHAFAYIGPVGEYVAHLPRVAGLAGMPYPHPDVRVGVYEKLPVDDVRRHIAEIHTTPMMGDKTLTCIVAGQVDHEAQNALLKVMEEPPAHATVVLFIPSVDMLLPTLRSRLFIVGEVVKASEDSLGADFLQKTVPLRQKAIEKIIKDKDTSAARALLEAIEVALARRMRAGEYSLRESLHECARMRGYLRQRGASIKFILEHLALALPALEHVQKPHH